MVVDSSALAAVLFGESGALDVAGRLADGGVIIGAPTRLEIGIVIEARGGSDGVRKLESLLRTAAIEVVGFTSDHGAIALEAFRRYGKGRHRASLNYGDCMSYAVAKSLNVALLYVGDDFPHTDILSAL